MTAASSRSCLALAKSFWTSSSADRRSAEEDETTDVDRCWDADRWVIEDEEKADDCPARMVAMRPAEII